jgi:hypothetical protein
LARDVAVLSTFRNQQVSTDNDEADNPKLDAKREDDLLHVHGIAALAISLQPGKSSFA